MRHYFLGSDETDDDETDKSENDGESAVFKFHIFTAIFNNKAVS